MCNLETNKPSYRDSNIKKYTFGDNVFLTHSHFKTLCFGNAQVISERKRGGTPKGKSGDKKTGKIAKSAKTAKRN